MQSAEKKILMTPARPGLVVSPSSELQAKRLRDWQHSLVGKFIGELVPGPAALKEAVAELWNPTGSLVTIPLHTGRLFVFKLSCSQDKDRIVAGGPYIVEGTLLALQPLPLGTQLDHVKFNWVPIWVSLTGIPFDLCYPEVALMLAEAVGNPTEADVVWPSDSRSGHVRVRVEIDAEEMLLKGSYLDNCDGSLIWINFEYEDIHCICRNCMFIGHMETQCQKSSVEAKYLLSKRLQAIAKKIGVPVVNDTTSEATPPAEEETGRKVPLPAEKVDDDADELFMLPFSAPGPDLNGLDFLESNSFEVDPDHGPRGTLGKNKKRKTRSDSEKPMK